MSGAFPVSLAILLWGDITSITPAVAQPNNSRIWDGRIMAQPFDDVPFRAVSIPDWVQEMTGLLMTSRSTI